MEQAKNKFINLQKKQKETERMASITGQNVKRWVLSDSSTVIKFVFIYFLTMLLQ